MVGSSIAAPVIAGLAIGIVFLILLLSLAPFETTMVRYPPAAEIRSNDDEDNNNNTYLPLGVDGPTTEFHFIWA